MQSHHRRRALRLALIVGCLTAAVCIPAGAYLGAAPARAYRIIATRPITFMDIPEGASEEEAREIMHRAYEKGAWIRDWRPRKAEEESRKAPTK